MIERSNFCHNSCLQVVRMGSVTEMKDISGEKRKTVVFKHVPEKGEVTVVDMKTRKRKTVSVHSFGFPRKVSRAFQLLILAALSWCRKVNPFCSLFV